jgi:hypothetical protein
LISDAGDDGKHGPSVEAGNKSSAGGSSGATDRTGQGEVPERHAMELANEFARVRVERDDSGNGPRLKITSVVLNRVIYLDPLQLESLTWQKQETFTSFLESPFGPEE